MANYGNSLAQRPAQQQKAIGVYLESAAIKKRINQLVGAKNGIAFVSSLVSIVTNNPALAECDNASLVSVALQAHSFNLSLSPQFGQCYAVPFNDKKRGCKIAQFQLGYKGYIQLAMRSGQYLDLSVLPVFDGQYIGRDKTTGKPTFDFEREEDPSETPIGYMTYFELLNGFKKVMYWSRDKMVHHADAYSPAFSKDAIESQHPNKRKASFEDFLAHNYPSGNEWKYSSFWYKDFDGMACKTMLRQLISKWGIMSIEMQQAFEADKEVIESDYVTASDAPELPRHEETPMDVPTIDADFADVVDEENPEPVGSYVPDSVESGFFDD